MLNNLALKLCANQYIVNGHDHIQSKMSEAKFTNRAEPNMLKILPIITSRISQNFDPLFLPTSSPIIPTYSCNFYCIGDNNVQGRSYIQAIEAYASLNKLKSKPSTQIMVLM